uniref:Uncharacterized protein n=1 Tax=Romanomermis culicivorax TaxID=13658 RepID=A0A915ISS7_ROMCU
METVRGPPGASSESMVTTFSAARDASVIRKGPMKSGWILFTFLVLVKRTRSLTVKSHSRAFGSKYSLLSAAAASRDAMIAVIAESAACACKSWSWEAIVMASARGGT